MSFKEYQRRAWEVYIKCAEMVKGEHPNWPEDMSVSDVVGDMMGMASVSGYGLAHIASDLGKKVMEITERDSEGFTSDEYEGLRKGMGDCLNCLVNLVIAFGLDFEDVAEGSLKIHGRGVGKKVGWISGMSGESGSEKVH
jgi:hypothetical protein